MGVQRIDLARFDAVERTPIGGLRVRGRLSRTGVLEYKDADGNVRREYRPAEEVFAQDSLATLRALPVTDLHPAESVTPDNWKKHSVGHVGDDVRAEGDRFVAATVIVQDAAEVERILKGERKELSVGYTVDLDETPGVTPEGERYDAVQRNIRGNHVGLGPTGWGRSGSEVALRLDGATASRVPVARLDGDAPERAPTNAAAAAAAADRAFTELVRREVAQRMDAAHAENATRADRTAAPKETNMKTFKVGAKQFRRDDDAEMVKAQDDVDALQKKADTDATILAGLKDALTEALGKIALLEAQAAAQAAQGGEPDGDEPGEDDVTPEVYDSITRVRALGAKVLGREFDPKAKPSAIKRAIVAKHSSVKLDGMSADFVRGLYDGIANGYAASARNDSLADAHRVAAGSTPAPHTDGAGGEPDADAAEARMRARSANAWKAGVAK